MRKKLLILFCGILTVALFCSNVLIASATSLADSKVKATCKVTVVQKVVSVKLSAKSKTIKKGKSFTLKATVLPTKAVTFTSTNKKVATVNSKGKVTAKKVEKLQL